MQRTYVHAPHPAKESRGTGKNRKLEEGREKAMGRERTAGRKAENEDTNFIR